MTWDFNETISLALLRLRYGRERFVVDIRLTQGQPVLTTLAASSASLSKPSILSYHCIVLDSGRHLALSDGHVVVVHTDGWLILLSWGLVHGSAPNPLTRPRRSSIFSSGLICIVNTGFSICRCWWSPAANHGRVLILHSTTIEGHVWMRLQRS